MQGEKHKAMKW